MVIRIKEQKWPFSLLSQESCPFVLVLLAYHISSWSLVWLNEVWLVNSEGQEALVPFRISFTTAVSHLTVGVTEVLNLTDFIQENRGLQR